MACIHLDLNTYYILDLQQNCIPSTLLSRVKYFTDKVLQKLDQPSEEMLYVSKEALKQTDSYNRCV